MSKKLYILGRIYFIGAIRIHIDFAKCCKCGIFPKIKAIETIILYSPPIQDRRSFCSNFTFTFQVYGNVKFRFSIKVLFNHSSCKRNFFGYTLLMRHDPGFRERKAYFTWRKYRLVLTNNSCKRGKVLFHLRLFTCSPGAILWVL